MKARNMAPPQDSSGLFTSEQIEAVKKAKAWAASADAVETVPDAPEPSPVQTYRKMKIDHKDSTGKEWRFSLDCSTEQAQAFRKMLAAVRGVRGLSSLNVSNLLNPDNHEAEDVERFCVEIEKEILQHLQELHPETDEYADTVRRSALELIRSRQIIAEPVETSAGRSYYWENY